MMRLLLISLLLSSCSHGGFHLPSYGVNSCDCGDSAPQSSESSETETNAGDSSATIANSGSSYGNVFDYMTPAQISAIVAGNGHADAICSDAIQAAADNSPGQIWFPSGKYLFDKPVLLRPGITHGIQFIGESRTDTIFQPAFNNIAASPQNVNALFINQANEGAISWRNLRFFDNSGYTGHAIYCVENGCADGSGQVAFTGQIQNCYFSFASTNAGYIYGGLNNYQISGNVIETCQGFYIAIGIGVADILMSDNVMFNCYGPLVDASRDSLPKNLVRISGVHFYGCFRDYLIKATNARNWTLSDITVGQDNAAPMSPAPSLFQFSDSVNVQANNFSIFNDGGPVGVGIDLSGVSGSFSNGRIQGADVGIRISGNATNDLSFSNVSVRDSWTAAFHVPSGSPAGRVRMSNCDLSDSQGAIMLHTSECALDIRATGSRFYNAGLSGAGNRILSLATSGDVLLSGCDIGRDSSLSLAAYFIIAVGTGDVVLSDCRFSRMLAPIGNTTGTQSVVIQ